MPGAVRMARPMARKAAAAAMPPDVHDAPSARNEAADSVADERGLDQNDAQPAHPPQRPTDRTIAPPAARFVSIDDVAQIAAGMADEPGAFVRVDALRNGGAVVECLGRFDLGIFNPDDLGENFGTGRYRLTFRMPNERAPRRVCLVQIGGASNTTGRTAGNLTAPPPPPAHQQQPTTYPGAMPTGYPVVVQTPQPAASEAASLVGTMMPLVQFAFQQMQASYEAIHRISAAQVPKSAFEQVREMLAVFKEMQGFRPRRAESDGGGDDDSFGRLVGQALMSMMAQQQAQQNSAGASPTTATPPPPGQAMPATDAPAPSKTTPAEAASGSATQSAATNAVAALLLASRNDPERDPAAFASVLASVIGPQVAQSLLLSEPGTLAATLAGDHPALAADLEFLRQVEQEFRAMFADESGPAPQGDEQ